MSFRKLSPAEKGITLFSIGAIVVLGYVLVTTILLVGIL